MSQLQKPVNEDGKDNFRSKQYNVVLLNGKQWSYLQNRYSLTPRERQIAELVCQGARNNDIAKELGITGGTAKTHIRNIYRKIQVKSKMAMLLRFVSDSNELFARYNATVPIPIVESRKLQPYKDPSE
ncbi:MAG: helix-turn-helix transcriptional regulator [Phycisphaerae bacterium]|nr:helix-turn-helix transcriptional regulator [Phycisphaerae bacterium]